MAGSWVRCPRSVVDANADVDRLAAAAGADAGAAVAARADAGVAMNVAAGVALAEPITVGTLPAGPVAMVMVSIRGDDNAGVMMVVVPAVVAVVVVVVVVVVTLDDADHVMRPMRPVEPGAVVVVLVDVDVPATKGPDCQECRQREQASAKHRACPPR